MTRRRWSLKTWAANLATLLISSSVVVAGLEIGARAMASTLGLTSYMQFDATLGWTAKPGVTKRHKEAGFDVTYRINRHGFRGAAHETRKPAGVTRLMLLGDSIGFGWGVDEGQHLSALVETRLKHVEVFNLSLSGYSTDQELLRFKRDGLPFQPDVVILQVTPNDVEDLLNAFANQKPKPRFEMTPEGGLKLLNVPVRVEGAKAAEFYRQSLPVPFKAWLDWHSYSYNFLNAQYHTVRRRFVTPAPASTPAGQFSTDAVILFNRIVAEVGSEAARIGATAIVVHAAPDLTAASVLDTTLPVVDLSEALLAARASGVEPWFRDGYHWNATGHRMVADGLIRTLREMGTVQ